MAQSRNQIAQKSDMAALSSVLEAEKEAARRVEAAHDEALVLQQQALAKSQEILARADRRIQALHSVTNERIEARKQAMGGALAAEKDAMPQLDPKKIARQATHRLAARIIGVGPK